MYPPACSRSSTFVIAPVVRPSRVARSLGAAGPSISRPMHCTSASPMPAFWAIAMFSRTAEAACRGASAVTSASSWLRLGLLGTGVSCRGRHEARQPYRTTRHLPV